MLPEYRYIDAFVLTWHILLKKYLFSPRVPEHMAAILLILCAKSVHKVSFLLQYLIPSCNSAVCRCRDILWPRSCSLTKRYWMQSQLPNVSPVNPASFWRVSSSCVSSKKSVFISQWQSVRLCMEIHPHRIDLEGPHSGNKRPLKPLPNGFPQAK